MRRCPDHTMKVWTILVLTIVNVTANASAADLLVGTATRSITPDRPVALAGHWALRVSQKVASPVTATALALESRNGDQVLDQAIIVSCDLVAIRKGILAMVREKVKPQLPDFEINKLFLCATHTHNAPVMLEGRYTITENGVMKPAEYAEFMTTQVAEAIVESWQQRSMGKVGWAQSQAVVAQNRRVVYSDGTAKMYGRTGVKHFQGLEGCEDHNIDVLFFWDQNDRLIATAINVPCPAQEAEGGLLLHADFWHPVREQLRKRHGKDLCVLGWAGAGGDQSSRPQYGKAADERMRKLRGLTRLEEVARRIVNGWEDAFTCASKDIRSDASLRHTVMQIELPKRKVTEAEADEARKEAARTANDSAHLTKHRWHQAVVDRFEAQQAGIENPYQMELHVLRLGDVAIASNEFELFTDFGIRIKARSSAVQTFIIQLAGPGTYLPTERAVRGGGYSAVIQSNLVGPEGGQVLVDRTVEIINELWKTSQDEAERTPQAGEHIYTYTLTNEPTPESYDESLAVACLQGIINRDRPRLYVLSKKDNNPEYWRKILCGKGRWLEGKTFKPIVDLNALVELVRPALKGAIIWDPDVPGSVNVASTIAGVEDGVVLSPEYAEKYLGQWKLSVLHDLRGRFTGKESGSKKNDVYRWAIREYLLKGRCSDHFLCLYEDAFTTRAQGDIGYVLTRDWAVKQRSFVYDLSPWGDEVPGDDPSQKLGTDLATYKMMLEANFKHSAPDRTTEVTGFFAFAKYSNVPGHKSAHDPVPTEWETVWLISPYNCYQNTISSSCYNQSFHSQAPWTPLKQHRPADIPKLANKAYVCFLMADYDSATPLYAFMPSKWDDPTRGQVPFAWGINPNLIETYPDIIAYLYETATDNDYFTADASAAGYMNPNRIKQEYLPLFVKHNKHFFQQTDMTIAPMVLDWDEPTAEVKDAFTQFAPDGFATIVIDMHQTGGKHPKSHLWKGMPVTILINSVCNYTSPEQTAEAMYASIKDKPKDGPGFFFFRIVWVSPKQVIESMETLRQKHPELEVELVDPYTFFRLFKQHHSK